MIRTINIILMCTSLVALIGVYGLKFAVSETASQKRRLQAQIEQQEADLSMIQADWAYLTQPAQIDPIVKRHADVLGLQVLNQKQIASIDRLASLPMRPIIEPNTEALDALFQSLDVGIDPMGTDEAPLTSDPQPAAIDVGTAPLGGVGAPAAETSAPVPASPIVRRPQASAAPVQSVQPVQQAPIPAASPAPAPAAAPAFDPLAALIEGAEG